MMVFVGCSYILQAALHGTARHPFHEVLKTDIQLSEEIASAISGIIISLINGVIDQVARVVLVQNIGVTVRTFFLIWVCCHYLQDTVNVLIVLTLLIFFLPKFCWECPQQTTKFVEVFTECGVTAVLSSQFRPIPPKSNSEKELTKRQVKPHDYLQEIKQLLTWSFVCVTVMLTVKYSCSDDQGNLPNLLSYLRTVYLKHYS